MRSMLMRWKSPSWSSAFGARASIHVAERAITLDERPAARARRAVAAAPGRPEHDRVARAQHVLLAVVDALAVQPDLAAAAGRAAGEPGRGIGRSLGHEAHHDRRRRLVLDPHLLTETAPELAGPARAGTHALVVEEERAVALGD